MAEYVERETLLSKLSRMIDSCKKGQKVTGLTALFQVGDAIMDCPAADVAPVVHGKDLASPSLFHCSVCGCMDSDTYTCDVREYRFCPACGAKIDEKAKPDPSVATIYKCSHCGMKSPNGYFCDFCGSRRYKEEDTQ